MKFTKPCFVRVDNPQERKELREWCVSIGYGLPETWRYKRYDKFKILCAEESKIFRRLEKVDDGIIDCGTNIALFKALAAMNDENDNYQWFYDPIGAKLSPNVFSGMNYNHVGKVTCFSGERKATAEEIIDYFRK